MGGSVEAHAERLDELRAGYRITGCKKRDVMPQANKLLRQPGHHALSSAVEFRRDAFGKRSNLSYAHGLTNVKGRYNHSTQQNNSV